jgi:hypothetical protein
MMLVASFLISPWFQLRFGRPLRWGRGYDVYECAASCLIMVDLGRCGFVSDGAVDVTANIRWFGAVPAAPGVGGVLSVGMRWVAIRSSSPPCRTVVGCMEEIVVMVGHQGPRKTTNHRGNSMQ